MDERGSPTHGAPRARRTHEEELPWLECPDRGPHAPDGRPGAGPVLPPDELPHADQGDLGKHPRARAGDRGDHSRGQVRLQADARRAKRPGEPHPPDRRELLLLQQGVRRDPAEHRPLQGPQDPRRDHEGAPRELRLRRQGVGHAHRGEGPRAGRGTEQPEGAALVVHSGGHPGQQQPLRQPGRVRPPHGPGAPAERQPVVDVRSDRRVKRSRPSGSQRGRARRMVWRGALVAGMLACASTMSHAADLPRGPAILQQLKSFNTLGSVLYIAAHPDDENTLVIAYLARGRGYRTAYLSLTRGDGGQNLLGPQLREQLGVARSQELLAARRLDGGRQYFARANDFGYSKDFNETLQIWDRQAVLADIVRVIRSFRPDVIITRFAPEPGPTHGHHTASVVLAVEAFKLAGDPHAFPEQLGELTPWQPVRILHNIGQFAIGVELAGAASRYEGSVLKVEVGGTDPVSGESFA